MLKQGLRRLLVMALVVTMVFSCPTLHIFAEEVEDGTEIIQEESQETPEEEAPAEETPAEPEEEAVVLVSSPWSIMGPNLLATAQ